MPFRNNNNLIRKSFGILIPLFIICVLAFGGITAKAGSEGLVEPIYTEDGSLYPVIDYADLISDDEEEYLAYRIYDIQNTYDSALVILTIDSTGTRSAMEYADDFYDYNGYGMGEKHNGIIMLISMENRDVWFGTTGSAIKTFSDDDIDDLVYDCSYYLSDGNYYAAFEKYVDECEAELKREYEASIFTPKKFYICLAIGCVLGALVLLGFWLQLITVSPKDSASDYSSGGFKLTNKSDTFIRSTISKTKIEKESGSSTHSGSSGTSHGGGGGHF